MSDVIGIADFIEKRGLKASGAMVAQGQSQISFTLRDRADLEAWSSDEHRVSICTSELGMFAMLYQAGRSWASWGVVRQARSILLWDCVTLADIGRFPSMIDALAAVPIAEVPASVENIISFGSARLHTVTFA